jgi:uncharacterized SAM-binding protein YcdF (DUF218 family)
MDSTKQYKIAIVMGGFASMNKATGQMRYEKDRADRLWESVRLWRNGHVEKILITGDPTSIIQSDGSSTVSLFLPYMAEMGVPPEVFILEQQAKDTRQNAVNTAALLREKGIDDADCLLITSAVHGKRSLACFAKVGIYPDYLPVNIYDKPDKINHRSFYPEWKAVVEWEEILNEWIGEWAYRVMGYM